MSNEKISCLEKAKKTPTTKIFDSQVKTPKVTIAIPTYRRPNRLVKALNSALAQEGFDSFEVIVVDNFPERGCDTEETMRAYEDNPRVAYYKNSDNLGQAGNWNKLYMLAKGEYVVMLHDDDRLYPDFLRRMFVDDWDIVSTNDIVFPCYCSDDWFREHPESRTMSIRWHINDFVLHNQIGAPLGMTMKRETPLKIGGFTDRHYPSLDEHFYVHALASGCKLASLYGKPYAYYYNEENTSSSVSVFLRWWLVSGPEVFKEYKKSFNPVLAFLREKSEVSFDIYKLKWHSNEFKFQDHPEVVAKIKELEARETPVSKLCLNLSMLVNKYIVGAGRALRRKNR